MEYPTVRPDTYVHDEKGNDGNRAVIGIRDEDKEPSAEEKRFWTGGSQPPGEAFQRSFITYKDGINSRFPLDEVIAKTMGEFTKVGYFPSIKSINNLIKNKRFKDCAVREHMSFKESGEEDLIECVISNDQFMVRIGRSGWYGDKYGYYISLYTNDQKVFNSIKKLILRIITFHAEKIEEKGNINVLLEEDKSLVLRPIERKEEYIPENYPAAFEESRQQMIRLLNGKKGVFLLHSEPGCGKTTFIKSLPTYIPDKKFIFIPPAFGDILSSPSFLSFMVNQKNSILIIEDAESILKSRKGGHNHAVSNILNLTDGILSELLQIQVICTLNCNVSSIDEAVRRPGRLMWEQQFTKLSVEESNSRLASLFPEKGYTTDKELSIAEIYSFGVVNGNVVKEQKLGFSKT